MVAIGGQEYARIIFEAHKQYLLPVLLRVSI